MKALLTAVLCLLIATACFAQDAAQPSAPSIAYQPQYWLAAGAGFNKYASPQANGWLTFGVRVGDASYTYTTVSMTSVNSTLSAGYARILIEQDRFTLMALGDAGVSSGSGNVGGAFSGGGALAYDISRWTKIPRTYAVATVKVLKTSLNDVQPVFGFGIGKAF